MSKRPFVNSIRRINGKQTPEYTAWDNIKSRCYHETRRDYHRYGGRGIRVCDEWLHDFEQFYRDMGPKPTPKHQIDRINNDGDYSASNCRWATQIVNANNKRNNVRYCYKGMKKTAMEWAKHLGISRKTFTTRICRGWTIKRAIEEPIFDRGQDVNKAG
jgi:hypothetical protein